MEDASEAEICFSAEESEMWAGGWGERDKDTISKIREGVDEFCNVVGYVVILGISVYPSQPEW